MDLFEVSEEIKQKVRKEFNVTEEIIQENIEILKQWMEKQPHLPQKLPYDNFLEKVLLNRKFNVERSKETIENLFTLKTYYKDLFQYLIDYDYSLLKLTFLRVHVLKKLGPNNERIVICSYRSDAPINNASIVVIWLACLYLYYKYDYPNGIIYIQDLKHCTFEHIQAIPVFWLYKLLQLSLNGFGIKLASVHILNMKTYLQFFIKYATSLKPKLAKKIHYHKNIDSLYQHLPLEYLPVNMGGKNGLMDEQTDEFYSFINESKDELKQFAQVTTDENARVGQYIKANELFGCEGTFKKLNLD